MKFPPMTTLPYHPTDGQILQRASLGPAAVAARAQRSRMTNLGIPQRRFSSMTRGGSLGAMGCCGVGGPGSNGTGLGSTLSGNIAPPVIIGPLAARMISLRRSGVAPQIALLDAITMLHAQGVKTVTPTIHLQLAAGLQPLPSQGLSGLGDSSTIKSGASSAITGASVGASAIGASAASGLGIGAGLALGQTVIPIPVVGAVIGVIVWAAMHFSQRHVGKAEASWTSPGFYQSLRTMNGRDYDEKQFSESFKGMMDTGNNIVPGCGPDRHKNPDCLLGPMAGVIAQGYLSGAVPLTATTGQVFQTVVRPWLQSGAGGLVNWKNLAGESTQLLMLQAAADRYLAGQAMTRGDMPSYGNAGAKTPTLLQALQSILQQPTTTIPQQSQSAATTQPVYLPGGAPTPVLMQDRNQGGAPPLLFFPGTATPVSPTPSGGGATLPGQPYYPPYSGNNTPTGGAPIYAGQRAPITTASIIPGQLPASFPWGALLAAGAAFISLKG